MLVMRAQVTDQYNEKWQWDWITSDFWYALNFVFLVVICFLFRPSFNSTRYAYSELEGESAFLKHCQYRFMRLASAHNASCSATPSIHTLRLLRAGG